MSGKKAAEKNDSADESKRPFMFPEYGRTIMATDLDEAQELLKAELEAEKSDAENAKQTDQEG